MVSSGPNGVAPCDTHGSSSTPSSRTPTAPPGDDLLAVEEQRAVAAGELRAREPADDRHPRGPLGEVAEERVGREA